MIAYQFKIGEKVILKRKAIVRMERGYETNNIKACNVYLETYTPAVSIAGTTNLINLFLSRNPFIITYIFKVDGVEVEPIKYVFKSGFDVQYHIMCELAPADNTSGVLIVPLIILDLYE